MFQDESCKQKRILLYISTSEGIMSHYHQIEEMWNVAISLNRCLAVFAFSAIGHFSTTNISMCDYFNLPSSIYCLPYEYASYTSNKLNSIISPFAAPWSANECRTWLNDKNKTVEGWDFDYSKVDIICGYVHHQLGMGSHSLYRLDSVNSSYIHSYFLSNHQIFTKRMEVLYNKLIPLLSTNNKMNDPFVVIHWRRGDQLVSSCRTKVDISPNCAIDETELISKTSHILNKKCSLYLNNQEYMHYIATNEKSTTMLRNLENNGYQVFPNSNDFNDVDIFILEVMLACRADCFIGYGKSDLNQFVKKCNALHNVILSNE